MCGIYSRLSLAKEQPAFLANRVKQQLQNRGPDSFNTLTVPITPGEQRSSGQHHQTIFSTFASSVLSLRGDCITAQPLIDVNSGSVLCWNGEAWRIGEAPVAHNDSEVIFTLLKAAARCGTLELESSQDADDGCSLRCFSDSLSRVIGAISSVAGPFAFVFLDKVHSRVFFGRDPLGRRSLLRAGDKAEELAISSVSDGVLSNKWEEVEADGLYMVNLSFSRSLSSISQALGHQSLQSSCFDIFKFPWVTANINSDTPVSSYSLVSFQLESGIPRYPYG